MWNKGLESGCTKNAYHPGVIFWFEKQQIPYKATCRRGFHCNLPKLYKILDFLLLVLFFNLFNCNTRCRSTFFCYQFQPSVLALVVKNKSMGFCSVIIFLGFEGGVTALAIRRTGRQYERRNQLDLFKGLTLSNSSSWSLMQLKCSVQNLIESRNRRNPMSQNLHPKYFGPECFLLLFLPGTGFVLVETTPWHK